MNSHFGLIQEFELGLCAFLLGRILIHLACMTQDKKISYHWAGIKREFCKMRIR